MSPCPESFRGRFRVSVNLMIEVRRDAETTCPELASGVQHDRGVEVLKLRRHPELVSGSLINL